MNTFSTRMNALVLTASLVFAPAFAMEKTALFVEEEQESVMFEGFEGEEFAVETSKNEATVWYKKRSTQVAGVVAVAYAVAVCTGKARAPFALMAAITSLFCKPAVKNEETKTEETNTEDTSSTDVANTTTSNELVDQSIGGQFTVLVNNSKDKFNNGVKNVKAVFAQISNNWNNSADTKIDAATYSAQSN